MDADFKTAGTCHYSITKETFWNAAVFTPLRKNSPYTNTISLGYERPTFFFQSTIALTFQLIYKYNDQNTLVYIHYRILRLKESGLLNEWGSWYIPSTSKCMELNKRNEKPKLSIEHLSSAFVILIVGYIISAAVFVIEKILGYFAN